MFKFLKNINSEKGKQKVFFDQVSRWYSKYERYLIPGSLLAGVITDFILFQQINLSLAFSILTFHIVLSGSIIAYRNLYDSHCFGHQRRILQYLRLFSSMILQYSFGALLSGFFVFYWFSGVFSASWPFILIIIFLMLSNDLLKRYYLRLSVQIAVYYFAVFSWSVLILPFLFRSITVWIFLLSGMLSLIIIYLYIFALKSKVAKIYQKKTTIGYLVISIFILMNGMYFLNIIPPIPLSMRDAGVYHFVERVGGEYKVMTESRSVWQNLFTGNKISLTQGQPVYVFSSVFAPARMEVDLSHHWQKYDKNLGWVSRNRVPFKMTGGREEGFRGYSFSRNITSGLYRVDVETSRGQVIGRIKFEVLIVNSSPKLDVDWK